MDVELIPWPADGARLERARRIGAPRLLLVEAGEVPPVRSDPLEDWIRVPVDGGDVRVRVDVLARRARAASTRPRLEDGVLRHGDRSVGLSDVDAALAEVLLDARGSVVSRDKLVAAAWPEGVSGRNTVDVAISRLRRRVRTVGLELTTVRSRGYLLTAATAVPALSGSRQELERDA